MKSKNNKKAKISQKTYYNIAAILFAVSGVIWLLNPSTAKVLSIVYFALTFTFFALAQNAKSNGK